MQHKIAITGINGFVGKKLAEKLKSHAIFGLSRSAGTTVMGDITQKEAVEELFAHSPDILVHLAAASEGSTKDLFDANVTGTMTVFSNLPSSVKKAIFFSSYAAYGSASVEHYEEDALLPDTEYGLTKAIGEDIAKYYAKKKGITLIIVRPGTIYGPGNNKGVVNAFMRQASTGPLRITGDGRQKRSIIYIDDAIDAFVGMIQNEAKDGVYNCGTENVSILELAEMICAMKGSSPSFTPQDETKPADLLISSEKLIGRGYWRPQMKLSEGLKRIHVPS